MSTGIDEFMECKMELNGMVKVANLQVMYIVTHTKRSFPPKFGVFF